MRADLQRAQFNPKRELGVMLHYRGTQQNRAWAACGVGWKSHGIGVPMTDDPAAVTCTRCRRTFRWWDDINAQRHTSIRLADARELTLPESSEPDPANPEPRSGKFQRELTALINRHSIENGSNTPDFILAAYMRRCLEAFEAAVRARDVWYGVALSPNMGVVPPVGSVVTQE
jgi:hypothetical protein